MGNYTTFPIPNRTFTDYSQLIFPSDFGVTADGSTDDTAAINAMFASIVNTTATVVWPTGLCKISDTITIGSFGGGGQSHISIMGVGSESTSGINYVGPTNKQVLRVCTNTNFKFSNIIIQNSGSKGSTTGIALGGNGTGPSEPSAANLSSNFIIEKVTIVGFDVGFAAGINNGAASEGTFLQCSFANCNTGFTTNDFNSLDFNFFMCSIGFNGVGISSGVGGGQISVVGGSSSFCTTIFSAGGNSVWEVIDYRGEGDDAFMTGAGGAVRLDSCFEGSPASPFVCVTGNYTSLDLVNCVWEGSITLTGNPTQAISIERNSIKLWDTVHQLPLFYDVNPGVTILSVSANFKQNFDNNFPADPIPDFIGNLGSRNSPIGAKVFYEPNTTQIPLNKSGDPSFGVEYLVLNHVRHLSESTIPGSTTNVAPTPGQNLRVSGTFNTSDTLVLTFQRTVTITGTGDPLITATSGIFLPTDAGKAIHIPNSVSGGAAAFEGYITDYVSSTQVNVFPNTFTTPNGEQPNGVGKTATIGSDEPDANYIVAGLAGNANETFWVDTLASTGFTLHSSEPMSVATVVALIVR